MNDIVEKTMLTGYDDIEPIASMTDQKYRKNFLSHLNSLNKTKHLIEKNKWEDWLHAITYIDIVEPLYNIMKLHRIDQNILMNCSADFFTGIIENMPTRKLDVHLHRQVLKNPKMKHKLTDLEDWAALGMAACYCDVVVCEKHFANIVKRDSFMTKARIETNLRNIFINVSK